MHNIREVHVCETLVGMGSQPTSTEERGTAAPL